MNQQAFEISQRPQVQRSVLPAERRRFLVVEDDLTLQPFWEHVILKVDPRAEIQWATTEEGAEKILESADRLGRKFEFVITDILLAGMKTGVDLWKKFRGETTLFVFSSSFSDRKLHRMYPEEEDMPLVMQKPLNPYRCAENLRALMAYQNYFPADLKIA